MVSTWPENPVGACGLDDVDQRQGVDGTIRDMAVGDQPLREFSADHAGGADHQDVHGINPPRFFALPDPADVSPRLSSKIVAVERFPVRAPRHCR